MGIIENAVQKLLFIYHSPNTHTRTHRVLPREMKYEICANERNEDRQICVDNAMKFVIIWLLGVN